MPLCHENTFDPWGFEVPMPLPHAVKNLHVTSDFPKTSVDFMVANDKVD